MVRDQRQDLIRSRGSISFKDQGRPSRWTDSGHHGDAWMWVRSASASIRLNARCSFTRRIPRFASDPTTRSDGHRPSNRLTRPPWSLPYALSNGVFDTGIAVSKHEHGQTVKFSPERSRSSSTRTGEDMVEYETEEALDAWFGTVAILLSEILLASGVTDSFPGLHR